VTNSQDLTHEYPSRQSPKPSHKKKNRNCQLHSAKQVCMKLEAQGFTMQATARFKCKK